MDLARPLLDAFVAAGGTMLDTAAVYGDGASERAVGRWLTERGRSDDVLVLTKGAHPFLSDWQPRVNRAAVFRDLAESRERLGLDTIDLYLLHRDDPSVPVGPLVDGLNELVARGSIRAFGVSNWTTQRIQAANEYAATHSLLGPVASSPHFALAVPRKAIAPGTVEIAADDVALRWYRERQFPLFAWSSQARGFFSERFSPGSQDPRNVARIYGREDNWERRRRADKLARQRGCTPTQVALAWVLSQPLNAFAIVGPGTVPHLDDCLGALELTLSPSEVAWLNLETDRLDLG